MEAGERNRATVELVRNWCAHARIEKFGGVGLIEAQTGLPIGHHGLKCDHAGAGGIATWDLREAAIDFHDRNCVDCKMRKPVGFPNLSILVKERDERRSAEAKKGAEGEAKEALALDARRLIRARLRAILSPVSSAIVDHIEEFDERRDREHRDRICESARLAPEHFVPPLVEYIFDLTENEAWFAEAGLIVLHNVKANPVPLARLALLAMASPAATRPAARVLCDHISQIDERLIPETLPVIIELANPNDEPFFSEHRPPAEPELLHQLWSSYPAATSNGLDQLLSSRRLYHVELAARGLLVVLERDAGAARSFVRAMVSKFARASFLIDNFDDDRHGMRYLRDAIARAFAHAPDEVDAIVQDFIHGSDSHSRGRAFKLYRAALAHDRSEGPVPADSHIHRTAFRRLLWAATTEESDTVLGTVQDVFRGRPYQLEAVAREELDGLLGAVLLLDDRLRRHDEEQPDNNRDFLSALERRNRRSALLSLMSSFMEWASVAAGDDPGLVQKVVSMFDQIPEGRDHLKGIALGCVEHLGDTVEGLKLVLPHLYYGLVGPSAVVRSYAADALGEVSYSARANIPPLVYEAFSVLLWDQYVVVHKAAVRALRRFQLPESCRGRAAQALLNLIRYYSQKAGEDQFVVECVHLLAYELGRLARAKGQVGQYLIQVLLKADPLYVKSELRFLANPLGQTEGFADLLIRLIPHIDDHGHRADDELALLAELPEDAILTKIPALEKLGVALAPERPWLACYVIEALGRVGAWAEARHVAEAGVDGVDPTVWNRSRRISMRFIAIAAAFEEAIAENRGEDCLKLTMQWEENLGAQREHEADVKKRNSRSGFPHSL
jgi:hypothetical protein